MGPEQQVSPALSGPGLPGALGPQKTTRGSLYLFPVPVILAVDTTGARGPVLGYLLMLQGCEQ